MKVTDFKRNTSMLLNLTKCAGCLQRVVNLNKFVRFNSHYAALGLPPNATQKEIRDAYIKLSKEHHPDKTNQQDKASHEKFVKINTAYEVLSKETSKREYDLDLTMQNQPGKTYTGSYSTYRPPHYNPYAKEQPKDDPFSFYNYETYQRQRARIRRMHGLERRIKIRWENKKPEDIIIHFLMFTFILVNLNILFEDKPSKVRPAIFPEDVDLLARPIKRNQSKEEVARRMEMRKKQGYSVTKVEKNQNNEDNKSDMKNLSPENKNQVNRQNIDNKNEVKNQSSEKVSNLKNQILSMKSDVKNLSLDDSSVKNMRESLKERSDVKNQSNNDLQSKKESIRRIRDLNLNKSLDSEIDVKMAESIKV